MEKITVETVDKAFRDLYNEMEWNSDLSDYKNLLEKYNVKGWGKSLIRTYLHPYIYQGNTIKLFSHAVENICSAIEKLIGYFIENELLEDYFVISERYKEFTVMKQKYNAYQVISRLDAFFDPIKNDLKIIEINTDSPCTIGWIERMAQSLKTISTFKTIAHRYHLQYDQISTYLINALKGIYLAWCNNAKRTVNDNPFFVFSIKDDSIAITDLKILAEICIESGIDAEWAAPNDFNYDGMNLRSHGKIVDLLYRDYSMEFLGDDDYRSAMPVIQAYKDGNICMVNPFSSWIGGYKSMFAFLHDRKFHFLFSESEKDAIEKYIPWTQIFTKGRVEFDGKKTDILELAKELKDEFVLKPDRGYGGFKVYIGKDYNDIEWNKIVNQCIESTDKYILQCFIPIPHKLLPVINDDFTMKSYQQQNININLWAFGGKYSGLFARVSNENVINYHQGSAMLPCFYF